MTALGKIMAVFTAATSLVFLGFVWVNSVGGPNWRSESLSLDDNYVFQAAEGPNAGYSARSVGTGTQFNRSAATLPELVLAARKDLSQKQQEEITALDEELQELNLQLTDAEQFIQADLSALDQRSEELSTELQALDDQLRELTSQAIQKSQEAYDKRARSERLRNDITRLKTQLAEIRIDHVRGIEQRDRLTDLLIRYKAQAETLKRRHQQLQAATDDTVYDPAPIDNATETDPQAGATE